MLLPRQTACLCSPIAAGSSVCVLAVIANGTFLRAKQQPLGCFDQKASIDSFASNQTHSRIRVQIKTAVLKSLLMRHRTRPLDNWEPGS